MSGEFTDQIGRRRLLGSFAGGLAVGTAGCLGDDGDDSEPDDGHTYDRYLLEHPGEEPLEFTDEQRCPVCTMRPRQYPDWRCQLVHENGDGVVLDTPGCLFAYYAFQPIDSPVTAGWVTEYDQRELIDATTAHYVIVTDEDAEKTSDDAMGLNPRPFGDREDAVAYLEEWDAEELTESDIVRLEDVDEELAAIYRGYRLPT